MNKGKKRITALVLAAVICLGLWGCGADNDRVGGAGSANTPLPSSVFVESGTIATDSWGYTGSSSMQLSAPSQTQILVKEHTQLVDASKTVVSGNNITKISFSSDIATLDIFTLSAAAQTSAPGNFVSYVDISMGLAKSVFPALLVTVDVGTALSGQTMAVYNYDAGAGKWTSAQTAVVSSSGKITFPINHLSLWAIYR